MDQRDTASQARERELSPLVDSLPVALFAVDLSGTVTLLEGDRTPLLGETYGGLVGRDIFEHVAEQPDCVAALRRALGGEEASWAGALHGRSVELRVSPARAACGALSGLVGVAVDVTDRDHAVERVGLGGIAAGHAGAGLVIAEQLGGEIGLRILFVNAAFSRITGYAAEQAVGQPLAAIFAPGTGAEVLAGVTGGSSGAEALVEAGFVHSGGATFAGELGAAPIRDTRGQATHWVCTLRDVTARRQELEATWQRQKLDSMGVLAGGVAHDFNNLLTIILGTASLTIADQPLDTPTYEALETIQRTALRAAELTRQMLAYAGKARLFAELVDLNMLVTEAAAPPLFVAPAGVTVLRRLDQRLPPLVADATQVRRVLVQLLRNAAEALDGRRGTITVTTAVRRLAAEDLRAAHLAPDLPPGEYVALEVADTGPGMDPHTLARVFEPFFTTKFTGRGLGLAEVLGIVSGHRGAIRVTSAAGGGAIFTVFLPLGHGGLVG